jgi:hypothetical protein
MAARGRFLCLPQQGSGVASCRMRLKCVITRCETLQDSELPCRHIAIVVWSSERPSEERIMLSRALRRPLPRVGSFG